MTSASEQYRPRTTRSLAIATATRDTSSAFSPVVAIERLRMAQDRYHEPVLAIEIVELFASLPAGVVIDATLGGGGHAEAILDGGAHLRLLGIDRDPEARVAAAAHLERFGDRVNIVDATFADVDAVVAAQTDFLARSPIVGVLMDLGVSSHQLDDGERGFSFRADAPLDMRMDPTRGETAAELIARIDVHELARLLRENGGEPFCRWHCALHRRASTDNNE